jgi:hypothetical protein
MLDRKDFYHNSKKVNAYYLKLKNLETWKKMSKETMKRLKNCSLWRAGHEHRDNSFSLKTK